MKRKALKKTYPITVSDWIQQLNRIASSGVVCYWSILSIGLGLFTASMVVLSLVLNIASLSVAANIDLSNMINSAFSLLYITSGGGLFLIFFSLLFLFFPKFRHKRAIELLKKILKG